ncbi:Gfo/Idh/MocA family protein [Salinarimonas ramus]|uniref:Oxidoreductase n=1 Tax=Salinarimonas ramus TaxID=690164 RepID=A0A917V5N9_9HYPH|nr:Gfo/Idh/MocA family oxidoreductase [Salinarimonas ramus]GGK40268.1 oxidoreductase [Salinarimonas ramus]
MTIEASGQDGASRSRRLRLGMVGGGRGAFIGAVHRIAARLDDRWSLVAGALSSSPEKARASGADLLIAPDRVYDDAAAMAKAEAAREDRIDAVSIVTPNHAHFEPAKHFLEAGFHVICDKPLTTGLAQARELARIAKNKGVVFAVTHNYTGYPLIREARALVRSGALGAVRVVQVEYAQDWLATRIEEEGQKQAAWRTDPAKSGPAGSVGDIGSHAFNLAEFVAGVKVERLCADLTAFAPGRRLDDNAHMLLRFAGGARGALWCSQVAVGEENGLTLRVYGETGSLSWAQENPNVLVHTPIGEPPRLIRRNGAGSSAVSQRVSRTPSGHPEGYLEGFANLYSDIADQIEARLAGTSAPSEALDVPTVDDGVRGVAFIEAAVRSSQGDARWEAIEDG